jgi:hypothetical protein
MDASRGELDAAEGPFGTTDYRIRLEAVPLDQSRTFLHLAYSYTLRSAARMGMSMYLGSSGRDKVGFSVVDRTRDGRPVYVGGVRGRGDARRRREQRLLFSGQWPRRNQPRRFFAAPST